MVEEPTNTPAVTAASIVDRIFKRDAAMWLLTVAAVCGTAIYAQSTVDQKVTDKVDAGIAPVTRQVHEFDAALVRHVAESARVHAEMREDTHELQLDVRALYRAITTGQPQARLEGPPTLVKDGGP